MNSSLKTALIIVAVLVVVGVALQMSGVKIFGNNPSGVDTGMVEDGSGVNASSTTNNTNGAAGANSGQTKTTSAPRQTSLQTPPSDASLLALINTAKIRVPDVGADVVLSGGTTNFSESTVKGKITVGKILGKVATDNGYDVFVEVTVTREKQVAEVKYVALFRNVAQAVAYTSAVSIGDRVILNGVTATPNEKAVVQPRQLSYMISSVGYNLSVVYLDRKNGEPDTATPTLSKSVVLHVQNHILAR